MSDESRIEDGGVELLPETAPVAAANDDRHGQKDFPGPKSSAVQPLPAGWSYVPNLRDIRPKQ